MDDIWQKERRKYPRLKVDIPVQFIYDHEPRNASIEDISGGGCCIKISISLPKGESILMEFSINGINVIVKATPVWETHILGEEIYNIGVIFMDICENTKEKIIKYISEEISFKID